MSRVPPAITLLLDGFDRVQQAVEEVLDGVTDDEADERLEERANSISWLIWHLTRALDGHVADIVGHLQVWQAGEWYELFDLPLPASDTGFGHSSEQVGQVHGVGTEALAGYFAAVHEQVVSYVSEVTEDDLDEVIDASFDPPTTLGVRLVSLVAEGLQHAGQAAFIAGILRRRREA